MHRFVLALLLLTLPTTASAAGQERWAGTWNAPNLWRAVEVVIDGETARFRAGTATEKVDAVTRTFARDESTLVAEIEFLGTRIRMQGGASRGTAQGTLEVVRGESVLSRGTWSLQRLETADLKAAEILNRVRARMRFPGRLAAGFTIAQSAAGASAEAAPMTWSARVGPRGEIASTENGAPVLQFDGTHVDVFRDPFGWMPSEPRFVEKLWLVEALRSGAWLARDAPFTFGAWMTGTERDRRYVLEMSTRAGIVPARIVVNPATWLPESAGVAWDAGERTLRFGAYVEQGGVLFPGSIVLGYRGREQMVHVQSIEPDAGTFERPVARVPAYDRSAPAKLEGTRGASESDHLFVRPAVMGRDIGWFHVDTGAPFVILDVRTADSLGLEVLRAMGPRSVRMLPELRVGQLILRNLTVLVQDLRGLSAPDSAGRAGVLGGPVFAHAVVAYDYAGQTLSVFAPEAAPARAVSWQPLALEGGPVIEASFNGRKDRFYIDTGKSGTVSFLSHDAARAGLFTGAAMEEAPNITVEGASIELITHLDRFELGGVPFERPEARIKLPGTPNDDLGFGGVAGIVGRGFFADRTVIFDYAGGRIGFVPTSR